MKAALYIETSIASYLTARPSRDLVTAGRQQTTQEWWEKPRRRFDIFISRLVWEEASAGDAEAIRRRSKVLKPLRWLQVNKDAVDLGRALSTGFIARSFARQTN